MDHALRRISLQRRALLKYVRWDGATTQNYKLKI